MEIKKYDIAKSVAGFVVAKCAGEAIKEVVDVRMITYPCDKPSTRIMKYVGSAVIILAVEDLASDYIKDKMDSVKNICDKVKVIISETKGEIDGGSESGECEA